jgi:hypothetical protein
MSAIEKINGKTKPWQRRRFEKRPDEFIRDGERIKAQRTALKHHLAKRNTSNTKDQKGPKP